MRRGVGARLERGKDDFVGNCVLVVVLDLRGGSADGAEVHLSSVSDAHDAGLLLRAHLLVERSRVGVRGGRDDLRARAAVAGEETQRAHRVELRGSRGAGGGGGARRGRVPEPRDEERRGGRRGIRAERLGRHRGGPSVLVGRGVRVILRARRRIVVARLLRVARRARRVVARGRRRARGAAHQGRHPHGDRRQVELRSVRVLPEAAVRHAQRRLERPLGRPRHRQSGEGRNGEKKSRRTAGAVSLRRVVRPGRDFSLAPRKSPRARDADAARARERKSKARAARTNARAAIRSGAASGPGAGRGGGAPGATSKRASDAPKCFSTARANTPPARGTLMKNRQSDAATLESALLRTAPQSDPLSHRLPIRRWDFFVFRGLESKLNHR